MCMYNCKSLKSVQQLGIGQGRQQAGDYYTGSTRGFKACCGETHGRVLTVRVVVAVQRRRRELGRE